MFNFSGKPMRGTQDSTPQISKEVEGGSDLMKLSLKELYKKSTHPLSAISELSGYKINYIRWCMADEKMAPVNTVNKIKRAFIDAEQGKVNKTKVKTVSPNELEAGGVINQKKLNRYVRENKIPMDWIGREAGYTPQYARKVITGIVDSPKALKGVKEVVDRYPTKEETKPATPKKEEAKPKLTSEISLEDAKVLYKTLPHLRATLLIGFTDEELGIEPDYIRGHVEYKEMIGFDWGRMDMSYMALSKVYSQYPKGKLNGEVIYIPVKKANKEPEIISVVRAGFARGEISNYSFPFYDIKYAKEFLEWNKDLLTEWFEQKGI